MKNKSKLYLQVVTVSLLSTFLIGSLGTLAEAHSGGTNSDGCHQNKKTGDYHCH